jgi:hypothetical protein
MATIPQPPQPPMAPAPSRSSSNVVAIVLLSVGLVVLLSVMAIWAGVRFIQRGIHVQVADAGGSKKEVSIKTPFGGLEVNKNGTVTEAGLGLPIYPGAKPQKDEDSATVSLGFGGSNQFRIAAGKFETPDSLAKVRDFYQSRLTAEDGPIAERAKIDSGHEDYDLDGGEMGNFEGLDDDGKTVFKIKRKGEIKVVALKNDWNGTRIELVRVGKGTSQAN